METLTIFSPICGWAYTLLFAANLSAQCYINQRNQSTKGYSSDYSLVGAFGFFFYLMTQTEGIVAGDHSQVGHVHTTDFIFAVTSFILSSFAYSQTFMYPSEPNSRQVLIILAVLSVVFALIGLLQLLFGYSLVAPILIAAWYKGGSSGSKYAF